MNSTTRELWPVTVEPNEDGHIEEVLVSDDSILDDASR